MTYKHILGHRSMVLDNHRNALYANAINNVVNPESVVLDLGAGLGLHGLLAAQAGAKKVYLVEPEVELDIVARIADQNGLSKRIHCFPSTIEIIRSIYRHHFHLRTVRDQNPIVA